MSRDGFLGSTNCWKVPSCWTGCHTSPPCLWTLRSCPGSGSPAAHAAGNNPSSFLISQEHFPGGRACCPCWLCRCTWKAAQGKWWGGVLGREGRRTLPTSVTTSSAVAVSYFWNCVLWIAQTPRLGQDLAMATSHSMHLLVYVWLSCLHAQTRRLCDCWVVKWNCKSSGTNLHAQLCYLRAKKRNLHLFSCANRLCGRDCALWK